MINWLLGLDNLNDRIQKEYVEQLKCFLIKEDLLYLAAFLDESNSRPDDQVDQFYFWSKLFIRQQARTFTYQLQQLADELKNTKAMLKKCLLCECEIETLAKNWSDQLINLNTSRCKLYGDLAEFFRTIRSSCQSISETNEQFNEKLFSDNQISKLPVDTFDNILEAGEFNYVKLKSLVQLIKLEISELLTLIIFYYSINRTDLQKSLRAMSTALTDLIANAKQFNQQISEDCYYFTKFFMRTRHEDQPERNKIDPNQNEILFNLKSAKTKICSSLLMIENNLNSLLDDKFDTEQFDSDGIVAELTGAIDSLNLVSAKSKAKSTKQFIHKQVQKLNADPTVESKQIDLNEQVPEYEVFEAYIEDDEKIDRYLERFEDCSLTNAKYPDTLYGELKEVLDVKAKDHRTREAKALGVNEEDLPKPVTVEKRQPLNKRREEEVFINPLPQMPFNLIKLAANGSKRPNFLTKEENFGDDLSSDE